jgi:hypothetical protein
MSGTKQTQPHPAERRKLRKEVVFSTAEEAERAQAAAEHWAKRSGVARGRAWTAFVRAMIYRYQRGVERARRREAKRNG